MMALAFVCRHFHTANSRVTASVGWPSSSSMSSRSRSARIILICWRRSSKFVAVNLSILMTPMPAAPPFILLA